jgi:mediator of RNA polymerase II transcription subunit 13
MISGSEADTKLQLLELPMISVGKGETVIQASPSALRFWDKLGLRPRGGQKDVTAFVFYEDEGEERHQEVENWLGYLSTVYSVCNPCSGLLILSNRILGQELRQACCW